jgi:hypothetical protein
VPGRDGRPAARTRGAATKAATAEAGLAPLLHCRPHVDAGRRATAGRADAAAAMYESSEGAASQPLPCGYHRREPEKTVLHQVVREHLETFLAQCREEGRGLPRHVEGELRDYVSCGLLSEGFTRVRCTRCRDELLVAFSCKGRGFCPSCCTRRMHDTAAHLVDRVFPQAAYRQWVLAYPRKLRLLLACNAAAACESTRIFVREVFRWQRKQAKRTGFALPQVGAVSFTQRFGAKLNLNLHHHAVLPEGVFVEDAEGKLRFEKLSPPTAIELETILERILKKTVAMARRRGLLDEEPRFEDALAALASEAVQLGLPLPSWSEPKKGLSAFLEGFSLEAGTRVHEGDRRGLEHLCRYGLRPPVALSRLSLAPDGRVVLTLKRAMYDGTTQVAFTPPAFLRRLATLVPPARRHVIRYLGVFAPGAASRKQLAMLLPPPESPSSSPSSTKKKEKAVKAEAPEPLLLRPRRFSWASLLKRTFGTDVLTCPCGGRRKVLAFVPEPRAAQEALRRIGLPSSSPPIAKARFAPWQDELEAFHGEPR